MRLAVFFLLIMTLPVLGQDIGSDGPARRKGVRPNLPLPYRVTRPRPGGFGSEKQRMILDYRAFGDKVENFTSAWNRWRFMHLEALRTPYYDRSLFREEDEVWRSVDKRMRKLAKTRLSKNYLIAAEDIQAEKESIAPEEPPADWREPIKAEPVMSPLPERLPPPPPEQLVYRGAPPPQEIQKPRPQPNEPAQIRMSVTDRQGVIMEEYLAFLEEGVQFSRTWARWRRVHEQLMRSVTYDYQLFRREAELWRNLQTDMDSMRRQRAGKRYVEKK